MKYNMKEIAMRKIIGILLVMVFFMMASCDLKVEKENSSYHEIYSIHDVKLKPGANAKEFESYVMNEIAPLYNQVKGQHLFLAKGYVGMNTGQYKIFILFDSVEDRNRTYPLSGEPSEEFEKILEGKDYIWDKFYLMADGFDGINCTDYLRIE